MKLPMVVSWKTLKELLGWPYSRAHSWRLMQESYEVEHRTKEEGIVVVEIRNPDPFPPCFKLGESNQASTSLVSHTGL